MLERQLFVRDRMARLTLFIFCVGLCLPATPAFAATASQAQVICAQVAFSALRDLCEAVARVLPVNEQEETAEFVSVEPVESEIEPGRPLDLTPPSFNLGDDPPPVFQTPLLPALFGMPKAEGITLGGNVITSERDADKIEGVELRIYVPQ